MEFLLRGCCNGPQSSVQVVIVIYCGTREPPPPPHTVFCILFFLLVRGVIKPVRWDMCNEKWN